MSSSRTDSTAASRQAAVPIAEGKAERPKEMAKMSAIATSKAKRAKVLTSATDYSQPPPSTSDHKSSTVSHSLAGKGLTNEVGSAANRGDILSKKISTTLSSTPKFSPSDHHTTNRSTVSHARGDSDRYDVNNRRASYKSGCESYDGNDKDRDSVTKSERELLASSRRKMAAALRIYDDADTDEEDEDNECDDDDDYLTPQEAFKKWKAEKAAATQSNNSPRIRGNTSQDEDTDEEDQDSAHVYSKKRSVSALEYDSPEAHAKRAKIKWSGVNDVVPRTLLYQFTRRTTSTKKNKGLIKGKNDVTSGVKNDDAKQEGLWDWIKDAKQY